MCENEGGGEGGGETELKTTISYYKKVKKNYLTKNIDFFSTIFKIFKEIN